MARICSSCCSTVLVRRGVLRGHDCCCDEAIASWRDSIRRVNCRGSLPIVGRWSDGQHSNSCRQMIDDATEHERCLWIVGRAFSRNRAECLIALLRCEILLCLHFSRSSARPSPLINQASNSNTQPLLLYLIPSSLASMSDNVSRPSAATGISATVHWCAAEAQDKPAAASARLVDDRSTV